MSVRRHNTLWSAGALSCVFISTGHLQRFAVTVYHGDRPLCSESCEDPDRAAAIAERLWSVFIEART